MALGAKAFCSFHIHTLKPIPFNEMPFSYELIFLTNNNFISYVMRVNHIRWLWRVMLKNYLCKTEWLPAFFNWMRVESYKWAKYSLRCHASSNVRRAYICATFLVIKRCVEVLRMLCRLEIHHIWFDGASILGSKNRNLSQPPLSKQFNFS